MCIRDSFHMAESLAEHPNGMRFTLARADGSTTSKVYYSVGGGFIKEEGEAPQMPSSGDGAAPASAIPYPFDTMDQLLAHGEASGLTIPQMLRANERLKRSEDELNAGIDKIWHVMRDCISHGLETAGRLPGGLNVKRRAANLWTQSQSSASQANQLPHDALHQVSLYAMAVNEENAAGGRVVTAPPPRFRTRSIRWTSCWPIVSNGYGIAGAAPSPLEGICGASPSSLMKPPPTE